MDDKVPCASCGAMILATTAERTGGLCRPCHGGYREGMERSRRYYEEEKEYRNSALGRYWADLARRVSDPNLGFASLATEEKMLYAVRLLFSDVYRGGFYHYFSDMADEFDHAVEGLRRLGATHSRAMVLEAKQILFGFGDVPRDHDSRYRLLPDTDEFEDSMVEPSRRLHEIEKAFCADPDGLYDKLDLFAREHGLFADE